jgi:TolB protein
MLVRAYRLTDKFGGAILKIASGFVDVLLERLALLTHGMYAVLGRFGKLLFALLGFIAGLLLGVIGLLGRFTKSTSKQIATRQAAISTSRASRQASGGKSTPQTGRNSGAGVMARRSARQEMTAGVAEDPLRTQNRVLSTLVVLFLAVLIGVVIWATSRPTAPQTGTPPSILNFSADDNQQPIATESLNETLLQPTAVPTATEAPAVLQVGGTIAYTVRDENQAHTDIWVLPIDSRTPLRITNSSENDRDPAWSPDGRRLAYASRQEDSNWDIYLLDTTTSTLQPIRLTYNLAFEGRPTWSPDGQFFAYEAYQRDTHLDIFVMRADGLEPPQRLPGSSDTADFSPAWSPIDGRQIAFVSWRDGNKDIFVFNLDTGETTNITNTPNRHEDYPAWSPDGRYLAFSAIEAGIETVFIKDMENPSAPAQALRQGREPAWSPDGNSILFAVDTSDSTYLVIAPFTEVGITTELIQVQRGASQPTWTAERLSPAILNAGGLSPASTQPLYIEQVSPPVGNPPYRLDSIINMASLSDAFLSERVNDSFNALRSQTNELVGWDFLGDLTDAFWALDRRVQPGEPFENWHKAGRAVAFNRNQGGFPENYEVVREDIGLDIYWRVFVRVTEDAQNGQLGEPLRDMPWDFAAATGGDLEAYRQGGRLRATLPSGYYIDFTDLASVYGWERVPAGSEWRNNFNVRNYWTIQKTEGLTLYQALLELYEVSQLDDFSSLRGNN